MVSRHEIGRPVAWAIIIRDQQPEALRIYANQPFSVIVKTNGSFAALDLPKPPSIKTFGKSPQSRNHESELMIYRVTREQQGP